jgi:hypothetical protein
MDMDKPVLDVADYQKEFSLLKEKLGLLTQRFQAVAMDYHHHIDNSWGQKDIFELRDNVEYRFFSAKLLIEILIKQHFIIKDRFLKLAESDPKMIFMEAYPSNPIFDQTEKEISSIFDSFIYHIVSFFDYMGSLVNYICGKNKKDTLMWTQLVKSVRDKHNPYSKKPIASIIISLDNEFVKRLYDYRSSLIHREADLNRYSFKINLSDAGIEIEPRFIAMGNLIKHFKQLKSLSEQNYLSTTYVAFWVINKSISTATDLLFGLKKEMEIDKKVPFGIFGLYDEKTRQVKPVSSAYWHEIEYLKEKMNND